MTQASVVPFSDAPGETSLDEARKLYGSASGGLFIGTIHRKDDSIDFEFISRNRKTGKNDFGVVHNFGRPNEAVELVNPETCITCHRTGGPIFPIIPWDNTLGANFLIAKDPGPGIFRAFLEKLSAQKPAFRAFQQKGELFYDDFKRSRLSNGDFVVAIKKASKELKLPLWHGIDLAGQLGNAGRFEEDRRDNLVAAVVVEILLGEEAEVITVLINFEVRK